jgi:hypothetical protein
MGRHASLASRLFERDHRLARNSDGWLKKTRLSAGSGSTRSPDQGKDYPPDQVKNYPDG